jgi:hypothetical protein
MIGGELEEIIIVGHTEAYPPNIKICMENLEPLGITARQVYEDDKLPYKNNSYCVS